MSNSLLIKFTDHSSSFTHGVEYGRLLEKMQRGDPDVCNSGFPIREENRQVVIDTCNTYGYVYTFGSCDVEGWISFMAIKQQHSNN